ncbi:branched-subunit amino acid aminotransferase/4-amino-4-deoxychorismate lyase [Streptomyces sp. 1114.5]|uniref:aminotransferase class IV n=1 Tax=Streptomyces sp. 1114.5 TaxID=1938830 RepID=UPI000EB29578|nr:aminotransferase class IV [Streptomyces sp. 1114.5]RKT11454.1 branched-subunit amino acid aminotransferase/4-amino-4-deoxychorismate lyase [Streptomyces sp. 1114.5]
MAEIEIDGAPADPARLAALGLLNYGHFTTLRAEAGRVRGLTLHLDRLVRDCRTLFAAELDRAAVRERIRAVLPADGAPVTVRVTVYDPALGLERPAAPAAPALLVTTRPAAAAEPAPLRVRSVAYRRELPQVKHVGLFGLVHHRRQAQLAGWDDVLLVDEDGRVTEGATWNVGFLDEDGLVWPQGPSLPGVTEALLSGAYQGPQSREPLPVAELGRFTAAFAVNAGIGLRPLAAVDGTALDPAHPRLAELCAAYLGIAAEPL